MNFKYHLLYITLICTISPLAGQDFVDIRPFGSSCCLEFMTQAYRGNIYAVETEEGIPYKLKLNKIQQIEWVIQDSSASIYSMHNSGDILGAFTNKNNKTNVVCRDRFSNLKWSTILNKPGYTYTFLELNDTEFLIGGGTFYDSFVSKMDINGNVLWTTLLDKSIHHLASSEQQIFKSDEGYVVSTFDYTSKNLVFVKLDLQGNKLWEKSTFFGFGEGGVVIFQKKDGNFLVHEPDPADRPYNDNSFYLLEFNSDLDLISRDAFPFFPCNSDFGNITTFLSSITYQEDSIFFTGSFHDFDSQGAFAYFKGMNECWQRPFLLPDPTLLKCPYSPQGLDRIMKQRGQEYVIALDYLDADKYHPRVSHTDFSMYTDPRLFHLKVHVADELCGMGSTNPFTNNWMISRGSIQVTIPEKGYVDLLANNQSNPFRINSKTFGYDFCTQEGSTSDSVVLNVFPSQNRGLGLQGAVHSKEGNKHLKINYWSFGQEKVVQSKISITSNIPLDFDDDLLTPLDDQGLRWQFDIYDLEAFNMYTKELAFSSDESLSKDTLLVKIDIGDLEKDSINYLNNRTLRYIGEEVIHSVQSFSGSPTVVHHDDRVLFYISYTNTSTQTISDLQFFSNLQDFTPGSGMIEISSHPVQVRRASGPIVGLYSTDFLFHDISLDPGETAFLYFSIDPKDKACGTTLTNTVTTVVDYQHQDTTELSITLARKELIEIDTQLISGSDFYGRTINSDTIWTLQKNGSPCDTTVIYNISVTTTSFSTLADNGIKIGPNPFRNHIGISDRNNRISSVRVMDISGNEVPHQYFSHGVSIDQVKPGVYLLDISLKDGSRIRQKILKM